MYRRDFIKLLSLLYIPTIGADSFELNSSANHIFSKGSKSKALTNIAVVGGGIAGVTFAKTLKKLSPSTNIVLIEPKIYYQTCFMSNQYIVGSREVSTMRFSYDSLKNLGIQVVHRKAKLIDHQAKTVTVEDGSLIPYDKLVFAGGIDFCPELATGPTKTVISKIKYPHGWRGGEDTSILAKQIQDIPNGDSFIISIPPAPFRCPPGPYERASLIANFFKKHKPKSKVIIFDSNNSFSKDALFKEAWSEFYGFGTKNSQIEWVSKSDGGSILGVNVKKGTLHFERDQVKTRFANIIPPQRAAKLALDSNLGFDDMPNYPWCPVHNSNLESRRFKNTYVLGDSAATSMPKSAFIAYSQATNCAFSIAAELADHDLGELKWINTCYSLVSDSHAISVSAVYGANNENNKHEKLTGSYTPIGSKEEIYLSEFKEAHSWYKNFTHAVFG